MQDIKFTIMEYDKSREALKNRIHELNAQIVDAGKNNRDAKLLIERRSTLYTELSCIEYALFELHEYENALGREVNLKVG